MRRFETDILTQLENLSSLSDINGRKKRFDISEKSVKHYSKDEDEIEYVLPR